jgi:CelD/BcsL family acetyltransferase involved in cellulose biosynthesis
MSIGNIGSRPKARRILDAPSIISGVERSAAPRGEPEAPADRRIEGAGEQNVSAAARPAIRLELASDLRELEQEWRAFERRADCTAFQSFDWLAKWQRHIGMRAGTRPAVILGRDTHGELLFILPLAIEARGPIRRLTWLGSELCDYNAPLLARRLPSVLSSDQFKPLWREGMALLRADPRLRFDLVDLQKMPRQVGAQENPLLALGVSAHPSGAYVAELGRDWVSFYAAKRSSATRKKERQQLKRLADHGEIRFVEAHDQQDRTQTLGALIAQKARLFERMGVGNMFAQPGCEAFYRDLAADPSCGELVHVSRLDVGAEVAAASLGLRFGDSYYLVLSSYHDGEISRVGPGRAHLHELLRYAIEHGFRRFDFTVGDEPYKLDWSDIELRLWDHLAAVTVPGHAAAAVTAAFRRTKRFIKQTPVLWRAFNKVRTLAARIAPR